MTAFPDVSITLPEWVQREVQPGGQYSTLEERMRFVISLAARNVERGTGGPFGAAVFERDSGVLVAPGVNRVELSLCSAAHAESVALMVSQQVLKTYDLGAPGIPALELVTSSQPCIQCYGNVWWSGIRRLVTGTSIAQTTAIAGFDEGPVPSNWAQLLRDRQPVERAIEVVEDVLADEACKVLELYVQKGGMRY
jgi:tRNA(Arg) A34 adenosine deaminase TadA